MATPDEWGSGAELWCWNDVPRDPLGLDRFDQLYQRLAGHVVGSGDREAFSSPSPPDLRHNRYPIIAGSALQREALERLSSARRHARRLLRANPVNLSAVYEAQAGELLRAAQIVGAPTLSTSGYALVNGVHTRRWSVPAWKAASRFDTSVLVDDALDVVTAIQSFDGRWVATNHAGGRVDFSCTKWDVIHARDWPAWIVAENAIGTGIFAMRFILELEQSTSGETP